ncbi:MAG: thiolase domain-containing protein, partial [Candidatus Micrarchaeia archaeon]
MRSVSIVGAGLTGFGEHWSTSFRELIGEAGVRAVEDAGLEGRDVQAVYGGCMASGSLVGQEHV